MDTKHQIIMMYRQESKQMGSSMHTTWWCPKLNVCEETTVVFPLYMKMHKLTFPLFLKKKYVVKLQETSSNLSAQTWVYTMWYAGKLYSNVKIFSLSNFTRFVMWRIYKNLAFSKCLHLKLQFLQMIQMISIAMI